jgi:acetylornithine deacetylase/succinyl-diaminopimelate desuccinylase-like protein
MAEYEFEKHIDNEYLVNTFSDLLQVDTAVPLGPETLMEPDHPKLKHFVQDILRSKLKEIGVHNIIELPKNQIAVRLGEGNTDDCLIIQAYTAAQHHNWMEDPFSGKIVIPDDEDIDEPCAYGQGAEQNKAHFASILTLLKAFKESNQKISGTVYFVANNEARSTHECTRALLPELDQQPDRGILLIGGGNSIKVGNRGRVDVLVHVEGEVAHSSSPQNGLNAIEGANEVMNRIDDLEFTKSHPRLETPHAKPYQLIFDPVAPHTFPEYARLKIDRRLLPSDDIDVAVEEIEDAIGNMDPYDVRVEQDVVMEPSLVDVDDPIVEGLQKSIKSIDGEPTEMININGAFDAGGLTNKGIPTVMWGRPDYGEEIMDDDYVTLSGVEEEAKIVGRLITDFLR